MICIRIKFMLDCLTIVQSRGSTKLKESLCLPSRTFSLYSFIKESASSFSLKEMMTYILLSVLGLIGFWSFRRS